jgi:WXXGXW repeat (2 copies)
MKNMLLSTACGLFLAVGAANAQVVVRIGPPPPRVVETVPPVPHEHPGWVWQSGYHRYDGSRYVWVPGRYAEPPHSHDRWEEGRWVERNGGWVWIEGRWK